MKKLFATITLFLTAATTAFAQDYVAGRDFDVLSQPLRTSSSEKIEVVEFFAYTCGHCYNFEPLLERWKAGLNDDVVLVGSPAIWSKNEIMTRHAKAFYTAKALGVLDTMHGALFAAIHVDGKRLTSDAEIRALFVANGVDGADFDKAFGSFGVGSQARQAESRAKGARITGTPEMMVAGKYRITTRKAGGQANMLKIADFLIAQERAARQAVAVVQ